MAQILEGIKVLELATYLAGPMVGRLLAEFGADVVKIERPSGDPYRAEPEFAMYNRSKKSVTLNLKNPAGQAALRKLAAQSDVLIENFKPGTAKRYNIDYDTLAALNDRLIWCSISAFGANGPYANKPGWEPVVHGYAGIHYYQGGLKSGIGNPLFDKYGGDPIYSVLPYASTYNASQSAYAIVAALIAREELGKGQYIESPLFNSMLSAISASIVRWPGTTFQTSSDQRGGNPIYRSYQGSDGTWFFLAAGNERMVQNLYVALGHPEWVSDTRISRFAPGSERSDYLKTELEEIFATKTTAEWLDFLRDADVPSDLIFTTEQFMNDPQLAPDANDMVAKWVDPVLGQVRGAHIPIKPEETPGEIKGPAPLIGQHSVEVLGALGYSELEIAALGR